MKPRQYINVNVPAAVWISKQDLEVYPGDIPAPTRLSLSSAAWLMGARAPKASLQVMWNSGEQLITRRLCCPSKGPRQAGETGQQPSREVQPREMQVLHPGRNNSFTEKASGTPSWPWAGNVSLWARPAACWAELGRAGWGRWFFSSGRWFFSSRGTWKQTLEPSRT